MKSSEAFGHCAPCVEITVQPYRKSVKPEHCHYCRCYWRGRGLERKSIERAILKYRRTREKIIGEGVFKSLELGWSRGVAECLEIIRERGEKND